jgi:hypothetical protein
MIGVMRGIRDQVDVQDPTGLLPLFLGHHPICAHHWSEAHAARRRRPDSTGTASARTFHSRALIGERGLSLSCRQPIPARRSLLLHDWLPSQRFTSIARISSAVAIQYAASFCASTSPLVTLVIPLTAHHFVHIRVYIHTQFLLHV